jgi:hypothetical protein
MIPSQAAVEHGVGYRFAETAWDWWVESGKLDSEVGGEVALADAIATVKDHDRAFTESARRLNDTPSKRPTAATREAALGEIYAGVVAGDHAVWRIRTWLGKQSDPFRPEPKLLSLGQVASWVVTQYMEALGITHLAQADDAIARRVQAGDHFVDLHFPAPGGFPRVVGVPARSHLGEVAACSMALADRYRWLQVEATRVILTGESRPVARCTVDFSVRSGSFGAPTRIVLTLDPDMDPREVAGFYREARRFIAGTRDRVRPLSERSLRLAAWLASRPLDESWDHCQREWNRTHPRWRYPGRRSNFVRDARTAYQRLTRPQWELPHPHRTAAPAAVAQIGAKARDSQ